MAETDPPAPPSSSSKPNPLTRKLGPLAAWQWAALVAGGVGVVWFIRSRSSSTAAATDTSTTGTAGGDTGDLGDATGGGGDVLAPIVEQGEQGAQGEPGTAGPAGPPGPPATKTAAKAPAKASTGVGKIVSSTDFPSQIYALTTRGKSLVSFATIQNGQIKGKNVGKSGAPVYALIKTGFGPVWQQGFDPKKLPNGTKVATLAQFKSDIKAK